MTQRHFILAGAVVAVTLASLTLRPARYAVWNVSASVPTGLYAIHGRASLHVGERVAVEPPPTLRALLAERGYLPTGVPLLKRIAAVSGQRVCRLGREVSIDGQFVGAARARDSRGRLLPVWAGCHVLRSGELFVMNPAAPDSFDSRYFRVLRSADVVGRAAPVWTDEAGKGEHVWFADPRTYEPLPTANQGD